MRPTWNSIRKREGKFENAFKSKNGEDTEIDGNFFAFASSAKVQLFKSMRSEWRAKVRRACGGRARVKDEARSKVKAKYRERRARFNILESPLPPPPLRIHHLEYSAVMQVTIGACRCLPRPEIPIMEWIERLPLSFRFRFPFISRFAWGTLRVATEPYRKIARHLLDKDQQPCSLTLLPSTMMSPEPTGVFSIVCDRLNSLWWGDWLSWR